MHIKDAITIKQNVTLSENRRSGPIGIKLKS